ncbi:MarR family winged helix-turn-helix transcriptional regulator [Streptomyces tendae]|uniref:MarR family winged helix-turn-helix transcriptional regulator n=1 Tax=Streptomyces tendae TaxID=1932 RepID=UPI0037B1677B
MSDQGEDEVTETRWLTADQLAAWRGFVNLALKLPAALEWQLQRDSQLSFIEYYVLALLSDQPGRRMRMSDLAAAASSELSRLSHMVSRLEKRGIVRREPDPSDGRYTHAILTDAGYTRLSEAAPGHVGSVRELFIDVLGPEELQTLHRCSDKIVGRIQGVKKPAGTTGVGRRRAPERARRARGRPDPVADD